MNAAQFIIQQLIREKKVTLKDIGSFYLEGGVAESPDTDHGAGLYPGSIRFVYDPHAGLDESLVSFIISQTGKIRPLAMGDLDSYFDLARQFIHLGKPFEIEGLGWLRKSSSGEVVFQPGEVPVSEGNPVVEKMRERSAPEISFASVKVKRKISKEKIIWGGVIVILILVLLYFMMPDSSAPVAEVNNTKPVAANPKPDSPAVKKEPTLPISIVQSVEDSTIPVTMDSSITFRVVIKEYSTAAKANRFYDRLRANHDLTVIPADTNLFLVAINCRAPLADTAAVMDSLYELLGLPLYFEPVSH